MSSGGVDHVFLTRFNLPSAGVESLIRARENWLRERIELFERYTVPSIRAQTCQNFRWIVYFDPHSPRWLLDRVDKHVAAGTLVALFRESVPHEALYADLRTVVGSLGDQLLTTNLDNDDGLAVDFVARLQAVRATTERTAVYLRHGLIKSPAGLYRRRDQLNAFCSVRESWDEPMTCWADWHNRLGRHMPVLSVGGPPAWLQVVHDNNVSNRVRGRLTTPNIAHAGFGELIRDVPRPTAAERCRDLVVEGPRRALRDSARIIGKRAVLAIGDKEALDRLKLRMAGSDR